MYLSTMIGLFFEFLLLEGAQAGLSWSTILKKRENYRAAFDNFDPKKIAGYSEDKIQQLLQNPGIVRNRVKVRVSRDQCPGHSRCSGRIRLV